jgi:L-ascorbate metabolism protein UlaG (beta-lactamase superfamily)
LVDEAPAERFAPADGDLLFVGHAAARLGKTDAALIDPFLFPRGRHYPANYQPLTAVDLAPIAAILITHSHPDHYDPGSLLAFGADARIFVPAVARESLLSIDMATRLREIGFRAIEPISPGDRIDLGSTRVDVLPFYGEQPTVACRLHPEVRNHGATYLVRNGGGHTFYLAADSGRDADGDVRDLAFELRQRHGPLDVLLGGHRGFGLYPIHYLFSSVTRYLLFVPPPLWAARQAIMNDAHELIDTAEIAGARLTIPYAAGGAPWHWEMGLGPRLDGAGRDNPFVDPPPEEVVAAARRRSASPEGLIASGETSAIVLHPGDALSLDDSGGYAIRAGQHQKWPF